MERMEWRVMTTDTRIWLPCFPSGSEAYQIHVCLPFHVHLRYRLGLLIRCPAYNEGNYEFGTPLMGCSASPARGTLAAGGSCGASNTGSAICRCKRVLLHRETPAGQSINHARECWVVLCIHILNSSEVLLCQVGKS